MPRRARLSCRQLLCGQTPLPVGLFSVLPHLLGNEDAAAGCRVHQDKQGSVEKAEPVCAGSSAQQVTEALREGS